MSQIQVPKGWNVEHVGKICNEIYRYPTYYGISYEKEGVLEVRGTLIRKNGELEKDLTQYRLISKKTSQSFPKTILKEGDIVMTVRGTIGKIGLVPKFLNGANITANLMRLSPKRELCTPEFLKYFFTSQIFQSELLDRTSITTIKTIQAPKLKSIRVPLPPLKTQKRIVQKLDYVLGELEEKKKEILDIPIEERLNVLSEESVPFLLSLACRGKFTENWRKTNPDTTSAFEVLTEIDKERKSSFQKNKKNKKKQNDFQENLKQINQNPPFSIPKTWSFCLFQDISAISPIALKAGPFGSSLTKKMYSKSGYKIYGQEQVIRGDIDYGDYYIDEETFQKLKSCEIQSRDLLISLVGTIGRVLIIPKKFEVGIINPRLIKISLHKKQNEEYFAYYLQSAIAKKILVSKSHGGTMSILNMGILKTLPIPCPPPAEQMEIVRIIKNKISGIELIKNKVSNTLKQRSETIRYLKHMTSTILNEAFSGKLVN